MGETAQVPALPLGELGRRGGGSGRGLRRRRGGFLHRLILEERRAAMPRRSKSSDRWLREHFRDPYVQRAQSAGWRSRAVFKLEEIDRRERLLKPGAVCLDLGAAPGGWSQYAKGRVGPGGRIIATDLLAMEAIAG